VALAAAAAAGLVQQAVGRHLNLGKEIPVEVAPQRLIHIQPVAVVDPVPPVALHLLRLFLEVVARGFLPVLMELQQSGAAAAAVEYLLVGPLGPAAQVAVATALNVTQHRQLPEQITQAVAAAVAFSSLIQAKMVAQASSSSSTQTPTQSPTPAAA
jgi:hypothetical protein